MKKYFRYLICLVLILAQAGCGNSESGKKENQTSGVKDVLEQEMAESDEKSDGSESEENAVSEDQEETVSEETVIEETETPGEEYDPADIDVDLTALSSTMVYSEVYNIMMTPEDYVGKTVKMGGLFTHYYDETEDKHYYACVIQDATACCAQGIEFDLGDDYTFPDDYPPVDSKIYVTGVFDIYEHDGFMYCILRNAEMD